jgi:hypothetical protein
MNVLSSFVVHFILKNKDPHMHAGVCMYVGAQACASKLIGDD